MLKSFGFVIQFLMKFQNQALIHWYIFIQIQMGNICPCLRRNRKTEFVYDVHEETFDMQDDKVSNDVGEHFPKPESHSNNNNNILPDEFKSEETIDLQQSEDRKEAEKLVQPQVTEQDQKSLEIMAASLTPLNDKKEQEMVSIAQPSQNEKPVQEKPKFNANILKPKVVKKKYNPQDYRFANQNDAFRVKKIGSIKQQQFNIQNCKNCHFFVFDMTANVYIDDCEDCVIFIAPCQSTIFVRNCKRLTVIVATKQFRTYQCHDCIFSLYCKSQPVIESSSNLKFASFEGPVYQQLPKQFQKMRLQLWNNHWSQIHNFTKKEGENHFQLLSSANVAEGINWARACEEAELKYSTESNYVPFIIGDLGYQVRNELLILVNKQVSDDEIKNVIQDSVILKGFQGVLKGEGKDERKVLLLDIPSSVQSFQHFQSIGKLYKEPQEIEILKGKWFVCFKDSREQQQ